MDKRFCQVPDHIIVSGPAVSTQEPALGTYQVQYGSRSVFMITSVTAYLDADDLN